MPAQKSLLGSHLPHMLANNGERLITMPANWNGLTLRKSTVPSFAEFGPQYTGMPMLTFGLTGHGQCHIRSNGRTKVITNHPPCFNVHSSTYERDSGYRKGVTGSALALTLPSSVIQRYFPDSACGFDLETRHGCTDNQLRQMVFSLADEFQSDLKMASCNAEGLSLTILGWLQEHYSIKSAQPRYLQDISP